MFTWFQGPDGEPAGAGILSPESMESMRTPGPRSHGGYGLGHQILRPMKGITVVGSSGGTRGWTCHVYRIVETGDGLIALVNSTSGGGVLDAVQGKWIDAVFDRTHGQEKPQRSNAFTKKFTGVWRGLIEGAGDGTRKIPFVFALSEGPEGTVTGTYKAGHWKKSRHN